MKKVFFLAVLSIFVFSATNSKAGSSLNESEKRLVYHAVNMDKGCKKLLGEGEKLEQKQIKLAILEFEIVAMDWFKSVKNDPKIVEEVDVIAQERAKKLSSRERLGLVMECMNSLYYIWGMFDYNELKK